MSSFDYADFAQGRLISQLATGTTTGVTIQAYTLNSASAYVTWPTGKHILFLVRKTDTAYYVEKLLVASGTTQSSTTGVVTLGTLTRNLSLTDGTDNTGAAATVTWPGNTLVYAAWSATDAEDLGARASLAAGDAAVGASTTNEVDLSTTFTVPANDWAAGAVYHIHAFAPVNMSTGTLTLRGKMGSTTLFSVASISGAVALTIDEYIVCRTVGASGTIFPAWTVIRDTQVVDSNKNQSAVTIDTTTTNILKFSAQFTASDSNNSAGFSQFIVRRLV